jgi:hypothetical protein
MENKNFGFIERKIIYFKNFLKIYFFLKLKN